VSHRIDVDDVLKSILFDFERDLVGEFRMSILRELNAG
jgi:hypothetical protein